jgi:penicillin-binding protein 2
MAESTQIKDLAREQRAFTSRAMVVFIIAVLAICVLLLRLVQLQVVEYQQYRTRSDENRIQVQPIAPPRGLIFDRNGELLADNQPVFTLSVVTERVADMDLLLTELGTLVELTDRDLEGFAKRVSRARRPFEAVPLKVVLNESEIASLAVNRYRLPGVEVQDKLVRHYPFGQLMAHAVGSVRRVTVDDLGRLDPVSYSATEFVGKRGVERFYERSLHGEVGYRQAEIDARGRVRSVLETEPPLAGKNITLTLDVGLQIAAQTALGGRRGSVVAIDPRNGGVLAMVSSPGYDPNLFVTGMTTEQYASLAEARSTPLFNRSINGQYAPGSTFKPIVALAALSLGVTSWEETIMDRGSFRLPGQKRIYRDWSWRKNNSGGQGVVDLHRAIYRSSNVYFYNMGSRMEIDGFINFAAQFGYGQNTAIDIAGASDGLLPDPLWKYGAKGEPWYPGDNVNISIGQGDLLVTPLQLATVATLIANRGHWIRPRLYKEGENPPVEFDPASPPPDVAGVGAEDWERLIDAMEDVVHRGNRGYGQNGTAWAHIGRNINYRMAGKSGTAQVVEIRQGEEYDEEELEEYQRKHAWFIAFAPADDPQIALAVLVENGGGGSSVAGPVAREVIDAYLLPQLALK